MTEPTDVGGNNRLNSNEVRCSCGHMLGVLVCVGRAYWLRVGEVEARYYHGRCSACHRIVHFDSGDYQIQALIDRRNRARMDSEV